MRASEFWEEKNGDNREQVFRRERISYAIATLIDDQERAEVLTNNIDLIIKSYKVLNRFHERGKLNEQSAKENLFAMKNFLEDFASCL